MSDPRLPWEALPGPLCLVELECSGYLPRRDRVTALAALRLEPGAPPRLLHSALAPQEGPSGAARSAHPSPLPGFANLVPQLRVWLEGAVMVAHNAALDACFLGAELDRLGGRWGGPHLCTLELAYTVMPGRASFSLSALGRDLCGESSPAPSPAARIHRLHRVLAALLEAAPVPERLPAQVHTLIRRPEWPTAWPRIVGSVLPRERRAAGAATR